MVAREVALLVPAMVSNLPPLDECASRENAYGTGHTWRGNCAGGGCYRTGATAKSFRFLDSSPLRTIFFARFA
jgi:hypothetical protein